MDHSTTVKTAITPTLSVTNGVTAVEFYKTAFGAIELMRIADPDGNIVAELSVGGANFFVADDSPVNTETAGTDNKARIRLALIVPDPDKIAADAVAAGAVEVYPVADQDYGYRLGHIIDPYGHHWEICKPLQEEFKL